MDRFSNILKQRLEATQSGHTAHPSTDTLVAFVERGLAGSQRETVLAHLSVCPECREAVVLASPEAATANAHAAAQTLSSALHFPAAMRWASLAAALAVAVGVGVIAYEHEAAPPQRQAALSRARDEANAPVASPAPTANEKLASSSLESSTAKSPLRAQLHSPVVEKEKVSRARTLEKKEAKTGEGILARLSAPVPESETNKDRYDDRLKALPSAPEAQPALANKQDFRPMQAVPASPSSASVSLTADSKAAQDVNENVAPAKPSTGFAEGALIGGSAGAFVQSQPVPAKTVHAAAIPGSAAKTRRPYGMFGFVHWTISAAGKLQRRATDGTQTIVEPVPGAIVRAVAAEGIEVWVGGLRPALQNLRPRWMLFHSSDAGETWTSIEGPWQGPIERVNLAGLGSLTVIADDGTWSTGDGGKNWSKQ